MAAIAEEKEALLFDIKENVSNPIDQKRILDYLQNG